MTKYEVILYWSEEDQAFVAEVPELAGCAADGSTRQEALANVELVIGEWLETAREIGRPTPEPPRTQGPAPVCVTGVYLRVRCTALPERQPRRTGVSVLIQIWIQKFGCWSPSPASTDTIAAQK